MKRVSYKKKYEEAQAELERVTTIIKRMWCPNWRRQPYIGGTGSTEPQPCGICAICHAHEELNKK